MSFWVDASLFALLVWASQHALFLVCALACVVGPRLAPPVHVELVPAPEPARA
jgi:hypothetical protein